jgi:hypothetical protein
MPTLDQFVSVTNRKRAIVYNSSTFRAGQKAEIFAPNMKAKRGDVEISYVPEIRHIADPCTLHFTDPLPIGTCAGDLIIVAD